MKKYYEKHVKKVIKILKQELIHEQLLSIELLKQLAFTTPRDQTFDLLAKNIGLSGKSILSRYLSGKILPKIENIRLIKKYCIEHNVIEQLVAKNIIIHRIEGEIIVDGTKLLSNTNILKLIAYLAKQQIEHRIDKIVTPEVDGLPIGYAFAFEYNVPCLYLRKERPIAVQDFISEPLITTKSRQEILYAPKKGFVEGEKILVVDDIIRSGKTQKAIINLINKAKCEVVGIISLISIGSQYKPLFRELPEVNVIYEIPENFMQNTKD